MRPRTHKKPIQTMSPAELPGEEFVSSHHGHPTFVAFFTAPGL